MKYRTEVTIAALGAIAVVGLFTGNDPVTYIAVGALAGYLGKVNGAPRTSRKAQ